MKVGCNLVTALFLWSYPGCASATSLIASSFDGGVVIGADTRSSTGSFVANRFADKITQVYPGIFLARSGKSADTQFVADAVEAKLAAYRTYFGRSPSVRVAATITRNICYANKDTLNAGLICAGWDHVEGGKVFSVPQGGSLHEQPFSVSGSGAGYALSYCDANLVPGMGREKCVESVRRALELALARDGGSGGAIGLCVVAADGVEKWAVMPQSTEGGGKGGG
ncbi:unnamed protein product [Discosporangium mesarthrocarpum]